MSKQDDTLALLLQVINDIKRTGFTTDSVDLDFYLGGDLGIDSREMLEIFYEIEQRMGILIEDSEKRDLYTLAHVVSLVEAKLTPHAAAAFEAQAQSA